MLVEVQQVGAAVSGQPRAVLAEGQLEVGQLPRGHHGQHAVAVGDGHRDLHLVRVVWVIGACK